MEKKIDNSHRHIAYFSMEIGIDERMPTYAGGLGVLAGDTIKSCADLKIPLVAVTLLSKKGYFYQKIDDFGNQKELPVEWNPDDFLKLIPKKISVKIEGKEVYVQPWVYFVKGITGFKIPIIFLDTDVKENQGEDKIITNHLYGGDLKYRLRQEMVLGIGGFRMLEALGFDNVEKYHMNEGHSALLVFELLKKMNNDFHKTRNKCVFTTHTPVPAGHDQFELDLVKQVLGDIWTEEFKEKVCHDQKLNMTLLALYFSKYVNGVAKKHGEVSRDMFPEYDVDSITNGVHSRTWTAPPIKNLFDKNISGWKNDPFSLRYIAGLDKKKLWAAHLECKKKLIDYVNKETNAGMDYDYFTIGFARRFTAYKRPDLIFSDMERLIKISDKTGKIQLVFAGKAHPNDTDGKNKIKKIHDLINEHKKDIKIAFIENYDMSVAKLLISGVDIWLNNPLIPREASGTSGMKAAHNGVPQISSLDGWWLEGHIENITGWSIGEKSFPKNKIESDSAKESEDLYNKLEKVILPLYYEDRDNWIRKMRSAIYINASFFNTHRMVQQYVTKAYFE
ncbi:alpha-glucan family phosphorylase [Candidatus Woesearchaeota archaeon]|nr:alpha-glucan family phosphorylase [Candidatus Woesearchaeota archaeon]